MALAENWVPRMCRKKKGESSCSLKKAGCRISRDISTGWAPPVYKPLEPPLTSSLYLP